MSEAILRKTFENFAGGSFSRKRFPCVDSLFCSSKVRTSDSEVEEEKNICSFRAAEKGSEMMRNGLLERELC